MNQLGTLTDKNTNDLKAELLQACESLITQGCSVSEIPRHSLSGLKAKLVENKNYRIIFHSDFQFSKLSETSRSFLHYI